MTSSSPDSRTSNGQQNAPNGTIKTLRRLARYLFLRPFITSAAAVLLITALLMHSVQPLLFGRAVNDVANGKTDTLGRQAIVIITLALLTWIMRWAAANLVAVSAQTAMRQLRQELFEKMQTLSLGFHESRSTGELMSRITSDTEVINTFLSTSLFGIVSAVIQIVAVTILMLFVDIPLAIVVIVLAPVSFFVMGLVGKRAAKNYGSLQQSVGRINGYLEERVTGQKTLQAYGQASASIEELRIVSEEARDSDQKASFLAFTVMPLVRLVSNADVAFLAMFGGIRVIRGATSIGSVVSFLGFAQQFAAPIGQISRSMNQAIQASAGAARVFDMLDEVPAISDGPGARPIDRAHGDVVFDSVDFSYVENQQILFGNSFHAEPGEMIGLIGPTGAGKSTIINLIGRFYEIDDGEIRLDGEPIIELKVDDLRLRAAVVLQTPFLFSESIMYNLKYGRSDATDEECVAAAKDANAHGFISRLPDGYGSVLAESGNNLSQGQRQLLTIARAIVAQPDVLILDEATSSVDTRTEREIQVAMRRLMEGRTSFVIAHRLSTVRDADRIIALDDGRIQESGTHDELMAAEGFYYRLFMEQFHRAN
jgi:ABC-type multidrug transport system fused ATPase/permease subunit